jgi:DNA modification methylase
MMLNADARAIPLADQSVHCVVTSPPYWGLRDYGVAGQLGLERSPEEYVAGMVAVFREVWRVLRDDGTAWINLGDSYTSGGRDTYGTWSPDSKQATHTAIKDAKRAAQPPGLKPKDLVGIPWRTAFALQADGWYLRSDIIWSKPNPMPESVIDRPTKAHEYLFLLAKRERYYYDAETIKEPAIYSGPNAPDAIKSPYGQGYTRRAIDKRLGAERPRDYDDAGEKFGDGVSAARLKAGNAFGNGSSRNKRSVWTIATAPYPEAHFATFPEALVEPCILAGSPAGGMVLDPFAGSGTVGLVCQRLGRRFVGLELKPEYCAMAYKRTAQIGLL